MGPRIHLGIDPDRDGGPAAQPARDGRELLQFLFALAIELQDAGAQRRLELVGALPHPGEDDAPRVCAGAERPVQLAARDDVEAESFLREQGEERQVPGRLHRVAGEDVEAAQRGAEDARMPQERRRGIDVRRRPDFLRDARERHLFAVQLATPAREVIHGTPASDVAAGASAPASAASRAGGCGGPFAPQ